MSQDLFAAFGGEDTEGVWSNEGGTQHASPVSKDAFQQIWVIDEAGWDKQGTAPINSRTDDDDDFGDFEDASTLNTATIRTNQGGYEFESTTSEVVNQRQNKSFPPKASPKQPSKASPAQLQEKQENIGSHPFAGRMDLLFEAGEDEYDAGADELGDLSANPEAAMAYSKRIIAEQESTQANPSDTVFSGQKVSNPASKPVAKQQSEPVNLTKKSGGYAAKDPNVLFDADDMSDEEDDEEEEQDDDDFNDFESGNDNITKIDPSSEPPEITSRTTMPAIDLLALEDSPQMTTNFYTDGKLSKSSQTPPIGNQQPSQWSVTSTTKPVQEDDDWDDFETAAPSNRSSNPARLSSLSSVSETRADPTKTIPKEQNTLPPTNVPPPAIILSVFPSLFAEADDALFNAIGKLNLKQKQMLLAHPASHQFLKGYLGHCTVLARIISGRKLRWKRDQRLSQSMRIGPAGAGGKGGMKLAGLDKTEVAKEDREVLDVLRLWRGQVGKLRTAVTAASSAPSVPKLPVVPEIAEQMAVKSLKPVEGGTTAPHPCALCGLKREERIGKVDVEVEDSFGEWWVQGMNMHLACRNFWDEFERKLKSR